MQVFCQDQPIQEFVTHDRALDLARQAATKKHNDLSADGKKWFFLYVCKKPSVDCGFAVAVDRATAAVIVRSLP